MSSKKPLSQAHRAAKFLSLTAGVKTKTRNTDALFQEEGFKSNDL